MSMEVLLRGLAEKMAEEERSKPKPLPEAIVMELREAAKRYERANPFKIGDLITPATGSYYNGKGEPHLVIATCPAEYRWDAKNGSPHYGIRIDTRVLQIVDGSMAAFWIESAQFDPWPEPSSNTDTPLAAPEFVLAAPEVVAPAPASEPSNG